MKHSESTFNTGLAFPNQTRVRSQFIYCAVLLATFFTLGALPFLHISISVKSVGMVQSATEKIELFAPVSGRLLHVNMSENQIVSKGTSLFIIDNSLLTQQKDALNQQAAELKLYLKDISALLKENVKTYKTDDELPKSGLYLASRRQYLEQIQNATSLKQLAERIYYRYHTLYLKNVISISELEQHRSNFERALSDLRAVSFKYINQWEIEAKQYRDELRSLKSLTKQLNEKENHHHIKATITGSIQNLTGLQQGSYVYANQKIAEISPSSTLFAYCFVKPSDIGLLRKGHVVRFQVDAFNYNHWGILTGRIIDISDDVTIRSQAPYFKVKCRLNRNFLQLKNGYLGFLKKGMTLKASFEVANRSLYQLLHDKVSDWASLN